MVNIKNERMTNRIYESKVVGRRRRGRPRMRWRVGVDKSMMSGGRAVDG